MQLEVQQDGMGSNCRAQPREVAAAAAPSLQRVFFLREEVKVNLPLCLLILLLLLLLYCMTQRIHVNVILHWMVTITTTALHFAIKRPVTARRAGV